MVLERKCNYIYLRRTCCCWIINCCCNACSIPGPAGTGGVTLIGAAGTELVLEGAAGITPAAAGKPPPADELAGLYKKLFLTYYMYIDNTL